LYNRERNFRPTLLVEPRVLAPYVIINTADAKRKGIGQGDVVEVVADTVTVRVRANVSDDIAKGSVALPRHLTASASPMVVTTGTINKVAEAVASGD
jgi:NADH-quinone oxidoreductase subunit G